MDLTGRSLKQYQLLGRLGAGGMGVVYHARDTVLGREAAIKVLSPDHLQDEEARSRFLREARAASALNHPNVVTVYEIGSADGIDFIAMEFVPGHTLHTLLRQRRLPAAEAGGYALQAATALAKAHAAGVVHRDIKPGNIVITGDGLVKVLDFGLARLNEASKPDAETFATRAGSVLGTVAYMSPEQASGDEVGAPSDIFSLGVVLFEMLSGQLPFAGDSERARLHSLHFLPPKDLHTLAPEVPDELVRVVSRMLEKKVADRYGSMADVVHDLRRASGMTSTEVTPSAAAATPSPTVTIARDSRRPDRRMLIGVSAALIAGVAIAAGWMWQSRATNDAAASTAAGSAALDAASPRDLYLQARALLDRYDRDGNVANAIPLLERAVERDPALALGHATLTEAYHLRHQVAPDAQWRNLMRQSAERALALNADLAASHIAMGLALSAQDKPAEAAAAYRRAIELDPRNAQPHYRLATVLPPAERLGELAKAEAKDTNNWAIYQQIGTAHYNDAQYAQAAAAFEKARNVTPDNVRVLANLSAAYHMLSRYEDAASTLQRAIEIQPSGQLYSNLGTLRFFQGRYADAIGPFEKAVELSPNRYLYWGNLADAYRWSPGHKSKSVETYQRAIAILREQLGQKPGDVELRSRLAVYQAKSGDVGGATTALAALERDKPAQAAVLFRLAVANEVAGARDKALSFTERALKAGYAESEVRAEPELVNLRNDLRYHKIVALLPAPGSK